MPMSGMLSDTGAEAGSTGPLTGAGGGWVMGAGDGAAEALGVPAVPGVVAEGLAGAAELDPAETWLGAAGVAVAWAPHPATPKVSVARSSAAAAGALRRPRLLLVAIMVNAPPLL